MCYIGAMILKTLAMYAVLVALLQAPATAPAPKPSVAQPAIVRPVQSPSASARTVPSAPTHAALPAAVTPATKPDCNGFPCDEPQERPIVVQLPAPVPTPWLMRERIAWGANLVLAIVGYVGIMMAVSVLKKIERQTLSAEAAASAASVSAQAALLNAQAIIDSERPWLLISVEPSMGAENTFIVMVTNRGRTPASIVAIAEQLRIAIDESHLPSSPEYDNAEPTPPLVPIILLPGESSGIKQFSREEAQGVCDSEERFKRVANWDEKIFLFGKIVYRDLIGPVDRQIHETSWCCWYIHGRQKSGLVIAGPPGYNLHT
jgi:hypothetical protein